MIYNTATRNYQADSRLEMRSSSQAFSNLIEAGTNCSNFESRIITDHALEHFRIGQHSVDAPLQPGQMIWQAILANEPPGKKLSKCIFKRIVLTVHDLDSDRKVHRDYNASVKRGQQVLRMTQEAFDQETLLTVEDLAELLDCNERTIREDIKSYQQEHGIVVPTRGNKCDIGPGITHREKIIELYIKGDDPVAIARQMKHSLKAVESYIQSFCRIVYCQQQVNDIFETALITGRSTALVKRCLEIRDRYKSLSEYKNNVEKIESLGSKFWVAEDGKKKVGQ